MKTHDIDVFFREVTKLICGNLDINMALKDLVRYLGVFIPIDEAAMFYYNETTREVFLVASQSNLAPSPASERDRGTPLFTLDEEDLELLQALLPRSNQPMIRLFNDFNSPRLRFIQKHEPSLTNCSELNLNLRIREHDVGSLSLWARGPHRYTTAHGDLLASVEEPIAIAMSNARRYLEMVKLKDLLAEDNRAIYRDLEHLAGNQVIGSDFGLRHVMELVRQVAPMSSPVLLLGETGVGKEIVANAIHLASPRRDQPFVRVQCGAIPETLLDSELFGHEKGAFTGATAQKRGRFERAGQGTIFLDEIAELSPEAQVKLLRVLQEREFERVGGTQTLHTNVRVIAATHRNLEAMCQAGSFREDLWFRLNVFPIRIPPLRDRRQDIPALVQYFIERKSREMNLATIPAPAPGVIEGLMDYHWPGNVRELQNIIERALILSPGKPLQIAPLSNQAGPIAEQDLRETGHIQSLNEVSANHIRYVMSRTNGRIEGPGGAAELLQINPGTLRSRMRKLGIPFGRKAEPYQQR